jgi:hypothetical protein
VIDPEGMRALISRPRLPGRFLTAATATNALGSGPYSDCPEDFVLAGGWGPSALRLPLRRSTDQPSFRDRVVVVPGTVR